MKLFKSLNIFSRQKKSNQNGWAWLYGNSQYEYSKMPMQVALNRYFTTSSVFNAVDVIQNEASSIEPMVFDSSTGEFLPSHPLVDKLKNPNPSSTDTSFIRDFSIFYTVTGNNYIVALGDVRNPPAELFVQNPTEVTIVAGGDGFADSYTVTNNFGSTVFNRSDDSGRIRYIANDGLKEIYQTRNFNGDSYNCLEGISPLSSISVEIEQVRAAGSHNLSLLKNGATPSGAFKTEHNLDDDQYMRLKEQMDNHHAGSSNAGRQLILDSGLDYVQMSMNNKDMDFLNLNISAMKRIYNALGVPTPLIFDDAAKFANFAEAKLALYDNTVIPLTKLIYSELTDFLMPRYGDSENLMLSFNEGAIPALQTRHNENLERKQKLGIYTINELRALDGAEPLDGEGADQVYVAANMLPVAQDVEKSASLSDTFKRLAEQAGASEDDIRSITNQHLLGNDGD